MQLLMGKRRKILKAVKGSKNSVGTKCQTPVVAPAITTAESPPSVLDLTVTYDYSCQSTSNEPTKTIEELSDLFSFKEKESVQLQAHSPPQSALWTDIHSHPPPTKRFKTLSPTTLADSVTAIHHHVIPSTSKSIAATDTEKRNEGRTGYKSGGTCGVETDQSDEEDWMFWVQAVQELSRETIPQLYDVNSWDEEEESEANAVFQDLIEETVGKEISVSSSLVDTGAHSTNNSYTLQQIEDKRLQAINLLSQKKLKRTKN